MKRILSTLLVLSPLLVFAQTPQWIWPDRAEKTETVYFRKVVELPAGKIKSAKLQATCDNGFSLFVNGKPALAGDNWNNKYGTDIAKLYFKAPADPGKYEYICTYPGHGLTMWGILHVK